jgi:abortive infection bacteriophage resistance protein
MNMNNNTDIIHPETVFTDLKDIKLFVKKLRLLVKWKLRL